MPYYRCAECKSRYYSSARWADLYDQHKNCEDCGGPLVEEVKAKEAT